VNRIFTRAVVTSAVACGVIAAGAAPALAGQVVKEPGFVSVHASCDGTAFALLSHHLDSVGQTISGFATAGDLQTQIGTWAHEHGDQLTCVGPE